MGKSQICVGTNFADSSGRSYTSGLSAAHTPHEEHISDIFIKNNGDERGGALPESHIPGQRSD